MNLKTFAFYSMIIVVIALGVYVLSWTKTEGFKCIASPYTYSIELLEKANNAPVLCTCSVLKPGGLTVRLNNTGFSKIEP